MQDTKDLVQVSYSYNKGVWPEVMYKGTVIARTYWWEGPPELRKEKCVEIADVVANALNFYFNEIDQDRTSRQLIVEVTDG